MTALVWVDVETTGLDPARHDLWEVAVVEADGTEHVWTMWPDLTVAEPAALRINGFYDRTAGDWDEDDPPAVARAVARLTAGRRLAGACPWFDAAFLDVFLRRYGYAPAWSHRHLCVETYAAGALRADPVSLSDTAAALGLTLPDGRHSALVDARLTRDVHQAVLNLALVAS